MTYLSLAAQSLPVEARLLAGPVSFELASTAHAEGIEDRTTSAMGEHVPDIEPLVEAIDRGELSGTDRGEGDVDRP